MADATTLEEMVDRVLEGTAPRHVKLAAARGALPLPRPTLVRLYIALEDDEEEEIRSSATASLGNLDGPATLEVLGDPECAPEVLNHFARQASRKAELAELIAFHPAVALPALAVLASTGSAPVLELVLTNQERLLAQPALLDRLIVNPALRPDQRGRILELLDRAAKLQAEREAGGDETPADEDQVDLKETARLLDVDVGELLSESEILGAEELEASDDPLIRNAFQKIIQLNTAHKAVLAMKGGREERLILVRDSNKVVALGVLRNPRISENEVEAIARMRNVTDEVLRKIGAAREWTKKYSVILALIMNPRTPQAVSMNFVSRLTNKDLKNMLQNREVPELIRRMARRTTDLRNQKSKNPLRK